LVVIVGFAHRECLGNNKWKSPNISVCQTVEIIRFMERAEELRAYCELVTSVDDRDITRAFRFKDMQEIIELLVMVIKLTQPVLPNDLPTISAIMREVIM